MTVGYIKLDTAAVNTELAKCHGDFSDDLYVMADVARKEEKVAEHNAHAAAHRLKIEDPTFAGQYGGGSVFDPITAPVAVAPMVNDDYHMYSGWADAALARTKDMSVWPPSGGLTPVSNPFLQQGDTVNRSLAQSQVPLNNAQNFYSVGGQLIFNSKLDEMKELIEDDSYWRHEEPRIKKLIGELSSQEALWFEQKYLERHGKRLSAHMEFNIGAYDADNLMTQLRNSARGKQPVTNNINSTPTTVNPFLDPVDVSRPYGMY